MTPLRMCYLGLAIWGAVHPMVWFVLHMHQTGAGLGGLIAAFYANAATTGLTWDLSIAAMTLSIWVIAGIAATAPLAWASGSAGDVLHRAELRLAALSVFAQPHDRALTPLRPGRARARG